MPCCRGAGDFSFYVLIIPLWPSKQSPPTSQTRLFVLVQTLGHIPRKTCMHGDPNEIDLCNPPISDRVRGSHVGLIAGNLPPSSQVSVGVRTMALVDNPLGYFSCRLLSSVVSQVWSLIHSSRVHRYKPFDLWSPQTCKVSTTLCSILTVCGWGGVRIKGNKTREKPHATQWRRTPGAPWWVFMFGFYVNGIAVALTPTWTASTSLWKTTDNTRNRVVDSSPQEGSPPVKAT